MGALHDPWAARPTDPASPGWRRGLLEVGGVCLVFAVLVGSLMLRGPGPSPELAPYESVEVAPPPAPPLSAPPVPPDELEQAALVAAGVPGRAPGGASAAWLSRVGCDAPGSAALFAAAGPWLPSQPESTNRPWAEEVLPRALRGEVACAVAAVVSVRGAQREGAFSPAAASKLAAAQLDSLASGHPAGPELVAWVDATAPEDEGWALRLATWVDSGRLGREGRRAACDALLRRRQGPELIRGEDAASLTCSLRLAKERGGSSRAVSLLDHADDAVAVEAARTLRAAGEPEDMAALAERLLVERRAPVRAALLDALTYLVRTHPEQLDAVLPRRRATAWWAEVEAALGRRP